MHMIAYTSDLVETQTDIDFVLSRIVSTAQRENPKHKITGVLFFVDNRFLQIIEGDETALRGLMQRIEEDRRHKHIEYLIDTVVESRGFSSWNMESFRLGAGKSFDVETLKNLTQAFEKSLVPRSNMLSFYYKALLEEKRLAA